MSEDILCRLTKTDGTTNTLKLPNKQVELMIERDSDAGAWICEKLGVVSVEIVNPDNLLRADSVGSTKSPR